MYFDSLLPYALMYGMDIGDYWHNSDYKMFWAYREKHLIQLKLENQTKRDLANFGSWLNGVYIGAVIGDMFGGTKNFPENPIDFNEMEEEQRRLDRMSKEEIRQEKQLKLEQQSRIRKLEIINALKKRKEGA